jgi:transcriptional regulator
MLAAIVGIEIEVTQVEGKFKLSQNRSPEDQAGVMLGLASDASLDRQPEADALAQAMQAIGQRQREGGVRS